VQQLPPAEYQIIVAKAGFASARRSNLQLHVNEQATLDFNLMIGKAVQSIEVTTLAPPLNTTSATLGDVIDHEATVSLPLNGRQFTNLTLLSPGASPVQGPQQSSKIIALGAGAVSPSVSGQRPQQNNFTMDGVMNNNVYTNTWAISPPPDALEEFNVQSHITDAQFGVSSGANINIATRPGTDRVHGSLWEFIRNNALDAHSYPSTSNLPYRQNQYGLFFGGPVRVPHVDWIRQTWLAGYWEGFRSTKSQSQYGNTLTPAMAGGDFSALLGVQVGTDSLGRPQYKNEIYDPATSRPDPTNPSAVLRDPFVTNGVLNVLPTSRINPSSAILIKKYYPAPNVGNGNVLPNILFTGVNAINSDSWGIRLDHRFNNDTVFGRFSHSRATQTTPEGLPGYHHAVLNYSQQIALGYTHLIGNSSVLQVHFANTKTNIGNFDDPMGQNLVNSINFGLTQPPKYGIYLGPNVGLSNGFSSISQGDTLNGPQNNYEYHADYSKVMGNHTLGAGFLYYHLHSISDGWNFSLSFTQNATSQAALASTTGLGPASFLLGLPDSYSAWLGNTGINQAVTWYGGYVQDQWQMTNKLALTVGLRYDVTSTPDYFGRVIGSLDAITGTFCVNHPAPPYFSQATCPAGYFTPQYDGYEPRVGLAYKVTDRTVIRSAFAKLDDHNNSLVQQNQDLRLSWPSSVSKSVNSLNRGLPSTYFDALPPASTLFGTGVAPYASYGAHPDNRIPYSLEYNLGVETQMNRSLVLILDYVGSVSKHLFLGLQANTAPTPGPGTIASRAPYPQYGGVFQFDLNQGISNYNSLQAQLKKSLSHGLFFNVSYTFSKAMDMQSSGQSGSPVNYYNLRMAYGPADFDRRQMLVMSGVYVLPFGRGKAHLNNSSTILEMIAGNWNLGAIASLYSGAPFNASAGGDVANTGGSNQRAQRIGSSPYQRAFSATSKRWLNPAAFSVPASYTWGNESRNDLVGPPFKDVDLNLYKDFSVKELLKIQFRSEFFNLFNHSNYSNPTTAVTSSSFGLITGASYAREIQFGLKVMF
jgi:hypothetical protein